jgi:hypothetical protein
MGSYSTQQLTLIAAGIIQPSSSAAAADTAAVVTAGSLLRQLLFWQVCCWRVLRPQPCVWQRLLLCWSAVHEQQHVLRRGAGLRQHVLPFWQHLHQQPVCAGWQYTLRRLDMRTR